jgi:hypothetical protein
MTCRWSNVLHSVGSAPSSRFPDAYLLLAHCESVCIGGLQQPINFTYRYSIDLIMLHEAGSVPKNLLFASCITLMLGHAENCSGNVPLNWFAVSVLRTKQHGC